MDQKIESGELRSAIIDILLATQKQSEGVTADAIIFTIYKHNLERDPAESAHCPHCANAGWVPSDTEGESVRCIHCKNADYLERIEAASSRQPESEPVVLHNMREDKIWGDFQAWIASTQFADASPGAVKLLFAGYLGSCEEYDPLIRDLNHQIEAFKECPQPAAQVPDDYITVRDMDNLGDGESLVLHLANGTAAVLSGEQIAGLDLGAEQPESEPLRIPVEPIETGLTRARKEDSVAVQAAMVQTAIREYYDRHGHYITRAQPAAPYEGCICQGCGNQFYDDVQVPDAVWKEIQPQHKPVGAGLLCGQCIYSRTRAITPATQSQPAALPEEYKNLYEKANRLVAQVGFAGEIDSRANEVSQLLSALEEIDTNGLCPAAPPLPDKCNTLSNATSNDGGGIPESVGQQVVSLPEGWRETLENIRDLVAGAPIDALGSGEAPDCPPWSRRDEAIDGISKLLSAAPPVPDKPQCTDGDVVADLILADVEGNHGVICSGLMQDFQRSACQFSVRHSDESITDVYVQFRYSEPPGHGEPVGGG